MRFPPSPFPIGQDATLTCTNDAGVADLIEWRSSDGTVLNSSTSVSMLELRFTPVNDSLSLHGMEFTCYVTRTTGTFNQTLSIAVDGM